jgi:uncharacterized protein
VDRSTVIERLKAHEAELRAMGVTALSLFGSVARDEAGPDSDVDLLARIDRERIRTLYDLGGLADHVEQVLKTRVDILTEPIEKPRLAAEVERDRVHVF